MLAFLLARILVVSAGEHAVNLSLVDDSSLIIQGKHLYGEAGDTVKVVPEGDLRIKAPVAWDLALNSESGDLSLKCLSDSGPFPRSVAVITVSGNLFLERAFPTSFTFTSMSGDVSVAGETVAGDWTGSEYNLQSASGRVDLDCPVEGMVWINTLTGVVRLSLNSLPKRASYDIRTGTGSVKLVLPDTVLRDNFVFQEGGFSVNARKIGFTETKQQSWLWQWGKVWSPLVIIDYNRVKGSELGLGLDLSLGGKNAHTAAFGASYAAAMRKALWFLRVSPRFISGPDFYLDVVVYDTVSTYDTWGMGKYENAVGALLFKEDARDYFARRGLFVGVRGRPSTRLSAGLGYEMSAIDPLEGATNFSFMGPPSFRPNPRFASGPLRALIFTAAYQNPGVSLGLEYLYSLPDSFDLNQIKASLRLVREGWSYVLATRLCAGYSFRERDTLLSGIPSPFSFGVGGLGTVPGVPYKKQTGGRALLWNGEYQMKMRGTGPLRRVMAFLDLGHAWDGALSGSWLADAGLGLSLYGVSFRVAQDLGDIRHSPRFFLRLEQRF